ncbi:putative lysine decarboxylase [Burkholderia contaminans]|uniref:Putative lysine decarboxylase n=1 Tax=Burkholderia contaminans TaxID=488447 RepID=A0A6P2VMU8_9BURK|nr:putative lysine decarboxylase [Burkholderia contaminans]
MVDRRDLELFTYCESTAQIWQAIGSGYALRRKRAPARCDAGPKRRAVQESADGICTIPTAASGKAD